MLNDTDFSIYGLEVTQAGGNQQSRYVFSEVIINDPFEMAKGDSPRRKPPVDGPKSSIRRPTRPQPEPQHGRPGGDRSAAEGHSTAPPAKREPAPPRFARRTIARIASHSQSGLFAVLTLLRVARKAQVVIQTSDLTSRRRKIDSPPPGAIILGV